MAVTIDGTDGITQPSITTAFGIPSGTTAQRPTSPTTGETRFNTDLVSLEVYNGTAWVTAGGGGDISQTFLFMGV